MSDDPATISSIASRFTDSDAGVDAVDCDDRSRNGRLIHDHWGDWSFALDVGGGAIGVMRRISIAVSTCE
jgi:hypothetical protein